MFSRKTRRERTDRPAKADRGWGRSLDRGGFPGLEGDFESERRRAAAADHDRIEPYEHGEGEIPVLPATAPGLTHP
ncbi:hypothetical protein [Cryobacterium sp. W22_MBD10_FK3]|uniref:hypothetical protein n=1 Tax=Cryobacterium sp. W22_MBD10_FK3 TaxID=3240273 RepID=UPI003F901FF0